jgi:hypothetical protein
MKLLLILFSVFISIGAWSQIGFSDYSSDTLSSTFRTFGKMSDNNDRFTVFDQSFISLHNPQFFLTENAFNSNGSAIDYLYLSTKTRKQNISALPHIGFGYVFGSQGAQRVSFQYGQVLPKDWVINTEIRTSNLEGFFRNTIYSESHYGFSLSKQSDKFGLIISGSTDKLEREWSGGVLNDSLLDFFAPQFIPVLKENCNSIVKGFNATAGSYFSIIKNEKVRLNYINESSVFGLNRVFNEIDTLQEIYEHNYFDTLTTRDQYQHSTVDHFSGLRIHTGKLNYSAGAKAAYWNYRNMGQFRDTLELNIEHKLKLSWERLNFYHSASYNVLGAFNEWYLKQGVSYRQKLSGNKRFLVYEFNNSISRSIPQVYQRFYLSNNTAYNNSNMSLESTFIQQLSTKFYQGLEEGGALKLDLSYELGIHNGIYYFERQNLNWINNSSLSDNTIQQLKFNFSFEKKNLNIRQVYHFTTLNKETLIIPKHYAYGSIDYKMGLFKDKKMEIILGLNYSLSSKTHIISVVENMGVYDLLNSNSNEIQNGLFNLGAYTSIEIETFRFFLKVNNLGYLWNDLQWNYIEGIYLPEVTVRLGITWDFWN